MTETLSTLSREQLQKLVQYAINEDPGGVLGKVFRRIGKFVIDFIYCCISHVLKLLIVNINCEYLTAHMQQFSVPFQYFGNRGGVL